MEGGFLDELRWRGLLHQRTAEEALDRHLQQPGRVAYCGFDPTADSLTIGNLVAVTLLAHWQRAGHKPIVLMGGGTGLIGDPSGKDRERPLLGREQVEANIAGQRRVLERLLDFDPARANAAVVVDNAGWLSKLRFIDVLRDVGKHFSVNAMIQKESVRERLHQRDQGISYTEFSYMLLQAYDFLHLHRELGCSLQLAGSDQYGNIVAGIDLIHRTLGHEADAFGVTAPLLTHADGRKIGKSEGGAIWLTADRTSPYAFYQYWINAADSEVGAFLRWFTLLGRDEIEAIEAAHRRTPAERLAQRALAAHMTERLHGAAERRRVEAASDALFGSGELAALDAATLAEVFADVPHSDHDPSALAAGVPLVDLLPSTALAASKREAREFLGSGAIWVNGRRVPADHRLTERDLLSGGLILLRRGKKSWHATRWTPRRG
ncbi:MAG TPA: tyrosine--tRNA ligase [Myxococcota bacterium]|nr:tyrosine--tRNA ligase [Myxococcota bacterium]